jgi:hypothetical protein
VLLACSLGLGVVYARAWKTGNGWDRSEVADIQKTPVHQSRPADTYSTAIWNVLVSAHHIQGRTGSSTSAERFRLAGTFAIESTSGGRLQKAILDDTLKNEQKIVGEGDVLDDVIVENIRFDRLTLRTPSGLRELVLDFASTSGVALTDGTNSLAGSATAMTNRFGCIKVQDDRWQFSRQPMLDYYQELLDEPDRMVALFDTMKPVRDDRNRITGYVVGMEGEKDFFQAVGLHEGDIVRQVNSVAMTNRRRAEFFIDEFLKNRMNAIVLDVERDGKVQKQVYQVKE